MTFSQSFVDMGRLGNGVLIEGGWKGVGKDALRAVSIVGVGGAVAGRASSLLQATQVGNTCVWTSAANSLRWTGQRFFASVADLAKAARLPLAKLGSLGRENQIVQIQQALRTLGVQFRVLTGAGRSLESAVNMVRANTGGVVNFSIRLLKAGKDFGGHRLYATYTRAAGLIVRDPNCPTRVFRTIAEVTKHLKKAYDADSLLLSDSPALFIKDAWLVTASHLAQRVTELSSLVLPLIPQIHVTASDVPTAHAVIRIHNAIRSGQLPKLVDTHVVIRGDTLSKLAEKYYRDVKKWPLIYAANRSAVGTNPNLIQPGTALKIPEAPRV
jgi:LysM repeat protein